MAVNNFDLIRPLLDFSGKDSYYYVQLLQRKKDGTTTFGNKNNSARIVQTYSFYDIDTFDKKRQEIIEVSNLRGCRACINFNKRDDYNFAKMLVKKAVTDFADGNYHLQGIVNTINGQKHPNDKIWVVDCDNAEETELAEWILTKQNLLRSNAPDAHLKRVIAKLPTYSAHHFITRRFDKETFDKHCKQAGVNIAIQENNPSALFYPTRKDHPEDFSNF